MGEEFKWNSSKPSFAELRAVDDCREALLAELKLVDSPMQDLWSELFRRTSTVYDGLEARNMTWGQANRELKQINAWGTVEEEKIRRGLVR